ncbi:MAG: septum formation initiator family protein [Candidatus Krumholzibacteriota bacterium]|nr:septum formation initiator family protein [Candidatus Krumholzibacteriota bacterium]
MKSLWGQGNQYLRVKRNDLEISTKFTRVVLVGVLILISAIFLASDVGLWHLWRSEVKMKALETEIEALTVETDYLKTTIDELQTNPFMIEKIARERYGYLRPGDRVYRIIPLSTDQENSAISTTPLDINGATE